MVLLIDDDEDDREVFEIALNEIDPEINYCTAKNGREATLKLNSEQNFQPDFIFLDLNMPQMNGWECLDEIRKIPRLNQTPVIIYTTTFSGKDESLLLKKGASAFVTKPDDLQILVKILSEIIVNKKLQIQL